MMGPGTECKISKGHAKISIVVQLQCAGPFVTATVTQGKTVDVNANAHKRSGDQRQTTKATFIE